jgi:outer membrane receptor protein involved in Fe transport
MTTRLLSLLLGLLGVGTPLFGQTPADVFTADQLRLTGEVTTAPALALYRPDILSTVDGALLIHNLPVLTLLDGRRFPLSGDLSARGLNPAQLVPVAFLSAVRVDKTASPAYGSDGPGGVVNLQLNRNYSGGEVGVFYGASGGKYGREDFQSYIRGGVGNDSFQISGGAAYSQSSGAVRTINP